MLGQTAHAPRFTCCPQIQKLADRSALISDVPKCSKIQIFRCSGPDPLGSLQLMLSPSFWGGGSLTLPRTPPRSRPIGSRFYSSQGLPTTKLATLQMTDFKCRPI